MFAPGRLLPVVGSLRWMSGRGRMIRPGVPVAVLTVVALALEAGKRWL